MSFKSFFLSPLFGWSLVSVGIGVLGLQALNRSGMEDNVGEEKDSIDGEERDWIDLAPDILSGILSRLVIGDYLNFQSVCKSWNSVILLSRHLSLPPDADCYQTPHLMYLNIKTSLFNFHDPTRNACYSLNIPQLLDDDLGAVDIYYASCGWLLVGKGESSYFFFNPSTKVKIDLPYAPHNPNILQLQHVQFNWMCFSGSPTSRKCEIFGIVSMTPHELECIGTLSLGENLWSLKYNVRNNQEFVASSCSPVVRNGNFYVLGEYGNLGKLYVTRMSNHSPGYWKIIGKSHAKLFDKFRNRFLLESDGNLMCVATLHGGKGVCVLKLDRMMTWQVVYNLNEKALYVSHWTSFSKKTMTPGTNNKIYFPRFYDHRGLFYCLATKEWRNFPHSFSSKNYCNTSEIIRCIWTELPSETNS